MLANNKLQIIVFVSQFDKLSRGLKKELFQTDAKN